MVHVRDGFQVDSGIYGTVSLDGLGFIVLGFTPEAMAKGNWSVGLIADEKASAEQREAITAIASGAAGGPMAALSGLIGKFLGVQPAPIRFDRSGAKWSVKASDFVDMAAEGAKGINPDATEPMHLDNTGHPAANRFALAHASRSRVQAFDLAWEDVSGKNNGQSAPFPGAALGALIVGASKRWPRTASSASMTVPAPSERPPTILESALRCERAPAVVPLVLLPAVSWMWIIVMARDMYGPMTGASAWMMTLNWDLRHLLLLWAMWAVMMTGMMLPSASPLVLLYGAGRDDRQGTAGTAGRRITRSPRAISSSGRCSVLGQPRFSVRLRRSCLSRR